MNTAILKRIRKARNADERDRLRLVGNIQDGVTITAAAGQVNKTQPWGTKWWKRFRDEGFEGLKDRPRSGRPPLVTQQQMGEVREEVSKTLGWTSDHLLDLICKKTGIRYCLGYGGLLLRKWGYTLKVTVKQHANRATKEEIARFQRNIQARIKRCRRNKIPVLIQDEAIFVADAKPRRVYTPPDVRAVTYVTGTHERTVVYGVLGLNGEQLFCQYDKFDADHFIEFLKEIKRRFTRALVIMDRAPQHKACAVKKARRKMGGIRIAFLPRATPELSAAEECWRQSKGELLRVSYVTVGNLRDAITDYFENKTFNLDVYRYLMRSL